MNGFWLGVFMIAYLSGGLIAFGVGFYVGTHQPQPIVVDSACR